MSKIEYTNEQIQELLNNPYVKDCSSKYITFTDEFKTKVLELDNKWVYHRKIFEDFWFPDYIFKSKIVSQSLWNWRFKMKNKGINWLINTQKWRKKKEKFDTSKMTKDEYIVYLEAKLALSEELKKLSKWNYP